MRNYVQALVFVGLAVLIATWASWIYRTVRPMATGDVGVGSVATILLLVAALVALLVLFRLTAGRSLPYAWSVALIGFPRSGKTTLLATIFGEIFARRIIDYEITIRGEENIDIVNAALERLSTGRALGPTTDEDVRAFRTTLKMNQFPGDTYQPVVEVPH